MKMSVRIKTLFAYSLHLLSNKATIEKSEIVTANDPDDSTNIVDLNFHLIKGICFFIATTSILLTILLNQKRYLKRFLRRHQGEPYDRKLNELQVNY